jgi:hypothetical protein
MAYVHLGLWESPGGVRVTRELQIEHLVEWFRKVQP